MTIRTIVDNDDNLIGYKSGDELAPGDIYRISGLWLANPAGEVLLARRALTKKNDPGKWGPSAAGTVEQGETYESNIYKEAAEELGLHGVPFITGPKFYVDDNGYGNGYYCQGYVALIDWPDSKFTPEPAEVDTVRWWPRQELMDAIRQRPEDFTVQFPERCRLMLGFLDCLD